MKSAGGNDSKHILAGPNWGKRLHLTRPRRMTSFYIQQTLCHRTETQLGDSAMVEGSFIWKGRKVRKTGEAHIEGLMLACYKTRFTMTTTSTVVQPFSCLKLQAEETDIPHSVAVTDEKIFSFITPVKRTG